MIFDEDIKVGLRFKVCTSLYHPNKGNSKERVFGPYTIVDFCVAHGKVQAVYVAENGERVGLPIECFRAMECVKENCFLVAEYAGESESAKEHDVVSTSDDFGKITDGLRKTFEAKNHDYGNSFHALFEECGMTYAYGHMAEKLARVKSLMKDEPKVNGESMEDSLRDLASYAILTLMELGKKVE